MASMVPNAAAVYVAFRLSDAPFALPTIGDPVTGASEAQVRSAARDWPRKCILRYEGGSGGEWTAKRCWLELPVLIGGGGSEGTGLPVVGEAEGVEAHRPAADRPQETTRGAGEAATAEEGSGTTTTPSLVGLGSPGGHDHPDHPQAHWILAFHRETARFIVGDLSFLDGLDPSTPLRVVCFFGPLRLGKSTLANLLVGRYGDAAPFGVGHSVQSVTRGLWAWLDADRATLFIDCEGFGDPRSEEGPAMDYQLLIVAQLIATCLVYNTRSAVNRAALETLETGLRIGDQEPPQHQEEEEGTRRGAGGAGGRPCRPALLWLVRDFELTLEEGHTEDTYLEEQLRPVARLGPSARSANRTKEAISRAFPVRKLMCLPHPSRPEFGDRVAAVGRHLLTLPASVEAGSFRHLLCGAADFVSRDAFPAVPSLLTAVRDAARAEAVQAFKVAVLTAIDRDRDRDREALPCEVEAVPGLLLAARQQPPALAALARWPLLISLATEPTHWPTDLTAFLSEQLAALHSTNEHEGDARNAELARRLFRQACDTGLEPTNDPAQEVTAVLGLFDAQASPPQASRTAQRAILSTQLASLASVRQASAASLRCTRAEIEATRGTISTLESTKQVAEQNLADTRQEAARLRALEQQAQQQCTQFRAQCDALQARIAAITPAPARVHCPRGHRLQYLSSGGQGQCDNRDGRRNLSAAHWHCAICRAQHVSHEPGRHGFDMCTSCCPPS